jgi:NADH-quinone oxidoreductase subunit N
METKRVCPVVSLIAGASILIGNVLAIKQTSLKRLLAYSSIAHFGYLMIALISVPVRGGETVWVYLATYVISTLGAFTVLTSLTTIKSDQAGDSLDDLRGLNQRNPLLAVALAFSLISLAGIPLTAGFIGKFAVLAAGVEQAQWALLITAVLGSGIGIFYYLRVVSVLFQPSTKVLAESSLVTPLNNALITVLALVTLIVGVWPGLLI